jgi:hypothetical protein
MKALLTLATILTLLVTACTGSADDKASAGAAKMNPLARFAGEWKIDGKWASGEDLHARSVYQWSLAKRILTAKTFVMKDGSEYQRYEGVMAWHPKKKSLYEVSFAFDGTIHETLIEKVDDNTLHIGYVPFNADEQSKVRQVLKFEDDDNFNWKVEIQADGKWQQIMDATWHRTK